MKKPVLLSMAAAVLASAAPLAAQFEAPLPSPKATVTQRLGVTDLSVSYSRPGVKGRVIWGGLVPYDKPWRTGANRATTLTVSDDFEVEGKKLPAGTYSIVTFPGKETWTVAFNVDLDIFSRTDYDAKKDALRVTVTPAPMMEAVESFTILFRNVTNDGAELTFVWEKLRVPVKIRLDTKTLVLTKGRAAVAGAKADDWETPLGVGRYFWNEKMGDPLEAQKMVQKSIAAKKGYSNLGLMARILAADGKTAEAIRTGEEAVALAKASPDKPNVEMLEKAIAEWKAKK